MNYKSLSILDLKIYAAVLIGMCAVSARAQTMERLNTQPWNGTDFVVTYDHPIFENTGHVNGTSFDTHLTQWDSYGRIRIDKQDADSPFVAYRILTSNVGTPLRAIHSTMDDFELAAGLHLGELQGWKIDTILGAGYSGVRPFLNEKGIFGIGDITATHAISTRTSLLIAVDYAGNNGLLPDVPLPGFAVLQHDEHYDVMLGFPVNRFEWRPMPQLTFTAEYTVPYTANLDVEYIPWQHFGVYANAANFYQGFDNAYHDFTDRQFFQMRRVEAGVRFIYDPLIDASVGIGYSFDQTVSEGYDIRSLRSIAHISSEPYVAIVLHGRF